MDDDLLEGVEILARKPGGETHAVPVPGALSTVAVYDANKNLAGGINKVSYTHEDMIDFILMNPLVTVEALARRYGYTQGWVSRITSSDAFRAMFAKKKNEYADPVVMQEVEERFRALTIRSLDVVLEKLEANPTLDGGLKALEVASRAQGYGVARGTQVQINQNYVVALPAKAADGRAWLKDQGHVFDSELGTP